MVIKKIVLTTFFLGLFVTNIKSQHPDFEWVNSLGGIDTDRATYSTIDHLNNIYIVGYFYGTVDFDPGASTHNLSSVGTESMFIQKLDTDGNLLWINSFGGTSYNNFRSITTDNLGNVYAVGLFDGTIDLDPGIDTLNFTAKVGGDVFIQKLDADGNLLWVKTISTGGLGDVRTVRTDDLGNVYTAGYFNGTVDFDPGIDTLNITSVNTGETDVFIQKLDTNGDLLWAKSVGGSASYVKSMTLDDVGYIHLTGYFYGTVDFDPGMTTYDVSSLGGPDTYILKLDTSGGFVWVKIIGSGASEFSADINVDSLGNVYTVGKFSVVTDFDPGVGVYKMFVDELGHNNAFIQKLDSNGSFIWAKSIKGSSEPTSASIDVYGNLYTIGEFFGTVDFDLGTATYNLFNTGERNIFIQKIDANGNFLWAKPIEGGVGSQVRGARISVDLSQNLYISGNYENTADFNPGLATEIRTSNGYDDFFMLKLNQNSLVNINELVNNTNMHIYPNPTQGTFNIETPNQEDYFIEVINITGKVIHKEQIKTGGIKQIDLGNYSKGIYLLKLTNNKETIVEKIVYK